MPDNQQADAAPRAVYIVLVYAIMHTSRTGKVTMRGPHTRGEVRDATTGKVLYSHKRNPFITDTLRRYCERRDWNVIARRKLYSRD